MLDLHCHILPGVDDGPTNVKEALDLARFCVRDGITHVTATPHCHRFLRLLRADVLFHVERFKATLAEASLPLTVLPGSEVQVTDSAIFRADFESGLYCLLGDGRSFLLLEFNWDGQLYPPDASGLVRWLRERGVTPIIAHPERHGFFRDDPLRLRALVEAGAWLQVTVDSLLGNHGTAPKQAGEEILRGEAPAVLATDAHNLKRCSGLSVGYAWVREQIGKQRGDDLLARSNEILRRLINRE